MSGFTPGHDMVDLGSAAQAALDALVAAAGAPVAGVATSAKQDAQTALLTAIDGHVDGLEGFTDGVEALLTSLAAAGRVTYADNSIGSATGASQQLLAANAARKALVIVNPLSNTTDWSISALGGVVVADTMPAFRLRPGDSWAPYPVPLNKITGIGTATSKLVVLEG